MNYFYAGWSYDDALAAAKDYAMEPGECYVVSRDARGKYYTRPEDSELSFTTVCTKVTAVQTYSIEEWGPSGPNGEEGPFDQRFEPTYDDAGEWDGDDQADLDALARMTDEGGK